MKHLLLLILFSIPLLAQTPMVRRDAGSISFTTAGTSTAYTGAMTPALAAYADRMVLSVKFDEASGATPTLNIDSLGARKLYKSNGTSAPAQIGANEIQATVYSLRYDSALDSATGGFILDTGGGSGSGGVSVTTGTAVYLPFGYQRGTQVTLSASDAWCTRSVVPFSMSITHLLVVTDAVGTKQVSGAVYNGVTGDLIASGDIAASTAQYGQKIPITATLSGIVVSCFVTDAAVTVQLQLMSDGFWDAALGTTTDVTFGIATEPTDAGTTYTWPSTLPAPSAVTTYDVTPIVHAFIRE